MVNRTANIVIRTPFRNTRPFTTNSLLKQGTSLGPILSNCSLDEVYVDDITDANNGSSQAFVSHRSYRKKTAKTIH